MQHLSATELVDAITLYEKYTQTGSGITLRWVMQELLNNLRGFTFSDTEFQECLSEIGPTMEGQQVDFQQFIALIGHLLSNARQEPPENDVLDAFAAMGGNSDKTGHVSKIHLQNMCDKLN
eukprot:TRINITY_DN58330_c0_g3_i1.p2 TRINITY_DN58330_c0_g3~~TRINITY_DN58330_c0_g3_i1.p2  ORF type:complete len:121 (+),score=17.03 TRINITY_DN58330_c0_g3_i1:40-402(+)